MRTGSETRAGWLAAIVVIVASLSTLATSSTHAADLVPTIDTLAGGPGRGQALDVSQVASQLAVQDGKLYIADYYHHVVRVLDLSTGYEDVVVGNGALGDTVDGTVTSETQLFDPSGVAVAPDGSVVLSQAYGVYKVTDGAISRLQGDNPPGRCGGGSARVAVEATGAILHVISSGGVVCRIAPDGTESRIAGDGDSNADGVPAIDARIVPTSVAVDQEGNILFGDGDGGVHRVRRIGADGLLTTIAGGGTNPDGDPGPATAARLESITDLSIDSAGRILISEPQAHRVRRVDTNGVITTIAGTGQDGYSGDGGPATEAMLSSPRAAVADDEGNVYISDWPTGIRRIDPQGQISTIAGTGVLHYGGDGGSALDAQLHSWGAVAVDSHGRTHLSDSTGRVRRVELDGTINTIAGTGTHGHSGDGGPAKLAQIRPGALAFGPDGSLYVSDAANQRVRRIDAAGVITTIAGTGVSGFSGDGGPATQAQLNNPGSLAVDLQGRLLVFDSSNYRLRRIDRDGTIRTIAGDGRTYNSGDGGPATAASVSPSAIATEGDAIFLSSGNGTRRIGPDGTITTVAPDVGGAIVGDRAGGLFITSQHRVVHMDAAGTISPVAGGGVWGLGDGGPATDAKLSEPRGLALAPDGRLIVSDYGNYRIRVIHGASPTPTTTTTSPTTTSPTTTIPKPREEITAPISIADVGSKWIGVAESPTLNAGRMKMQLTWQPLPNGCQHPTGTFRLAIGLNHAINGTVTGSACSTDGAASLALQITGGEGRYTNSTGQGSIDGTATFAPHRPAPIAIEGKLRLSVQLSS